MYTIIGGDGKEYGPVTPEQVRSWIAGGRANLDTRIKAQGSEDWKRVADFPEITEAVAIVAGSAALTPESAPKLDILSCYERSWTLLKANFWPLVGVSFLITLFFAILGSAQFMGVFLVSPLFSSILAGGLYYFFLRTIRGQPATLGDAFAGFTKAFLTLLVAGLIIAVFVTVGLILLVLPGIYLIVAYPFTSILAIDKGLGFWDAMETSRRVITAQWWRVLGLLLMSIPFILLGLAAFGVGIFVALPLITGAFVYAYEDLCNPRK